MVYVDRSIRQFIRNAEIADCQDTRIFDGDEACVTSIGYDLRIRQFYRSANAVSDACELDPGESIYVQSVETVHFGQQALGRVYLKNSRIRQGLSLESPVYQPGHKTRIYFRLRNVSDNRVRLKAGDSCAMLVFEQLEALPDKPYAGTFSDEDSFKGLAGYTVAYKEQIESVGGKLEKLEKVEERTYTNVSVLLTVFIGIFTLLNVNITLAKEAAGMKNFAIFNAGTVCVISVLLALVNEIRQKDDRHKIHWIWWIPVLCAAIAVFAWLFVG